ncbi:MAG: hypothetical protein V4575_08695 [Pseudomonadota bacterium]
MQKTDNHAGNLVLIRGAALWILMALLLAWCMVGLSLEIGLLKNLFAGKFTRLLQAHIDFLLMSALILGYYSAKIPLPSSVRWAMVIGAFTNSSLFLLMAIFPVLDNPKVPPPLAFQVYLYASLIVTSYGFGKGAVVILKSTFKE